MDLTDWPDVVVFATDQAGVSFEERDPAGRPIRSPKAAGGAAKVVDEHADLMPRSVIWASAKTDVAWVMAGDDETVTYTTPAGREKTYGFFPMDRADYERGRPGMFNKRLWQMFCGMPVDSLESFDQGDWDAFVRYNQAMADHLAAEIEDGGEVHTHDAQLALVPGMLRELRPDVCIGYFAHSALPTVEYVASVPESVMPREVLRQVYASMGAADATVFHAGDDRSPGARGMWARNFLDSCRYLDVPPHHVAVAPVGIDAAGLLAFYDSDEVQSRIAELQEMAGGRRIIFATSREDMYKELAEILEASGSAFRGGYLDPDAWMVVIVSKQTRKEAVYQEHSANLHDRVSAINEDVVLGGKQPPVVMLDGDFATVVAGMAIADVNLTVPHWDGSVLTKRESDLLSNEHRERQATRTVAEAVARGEDPLPWNPGVCIQVLSRSAGVYESMRPLGVDEADSLVFAVNPSQIAFRYDHQARRFLAPDADVLSLAATMMEGIRRLDDPAHAGDLLRAARTQRNEAQFWTPAAQFQQFRQAVHDGVQLRLENVADPDQTSPRDEKAPAAPVATAPGRPTDPVHRPAKPARRLTASPAARPHRQ